MDAANGLSDKLEISADSDKPVDMQSLFQQYHKQAQAHAHALTSVWRVYERMRMCAYKRVAGVHWSIDISLYIRWTLLEDLDLEWI